MKRTVEDIEREAQSVAAFSNSVPSGDDPGRHSRGSQERSTRGSNSNRNYGPHDHDKGDGTRARSGKGVRLLTYKEYRRNKAHSSVDYLVSGLIRPGTIVAICGRPGYGKTALAVALARSLDRGEPFLGREVKQAAVAYIAVEDSEDVAKRLEALEAEGVFLVQSDEGLCLDKPERAKEIVADVIRQAQALRPGRPVVVELDNLRAALRGQSVLDDKITAPALNALRELAEAENAVIVIQNHTNRENPRATKGETLEAVAALELILLQGEGDWCKIHVGKNRSGPGNRQVGRLRFTSVKVGGVDVSIVEEIICDEQNGEGINERKRGRNQHLLLEILNREILTSGIDHRPYGSNGPKVKAVRESVLRDEFMKLNDADNPDTKQKAINRALNWLVGRPDVCHGEDQAGRGLIWLCGSDDAAESVHGTREMP